MNRIIKYFPTLMVISSIILACEKTEQPDILKDTIIIGNQEWASKNLNVSNFQNGDPIFEAKTEQEWIKAWREGTPAWSYYDNDPSHTETYGKLYNHHAVTDWRGLCPEGWRVPTYEDWYALVGNLGDEAGTKLKSTSGWNKDGGTNSIGFNALAGGSRYCNGGFYGMGEYAIFSVHGNGKFYITGIGSLMGGFPARLDGRRNYSHGNDGLAVRCMRDNPVGFDVVPSGIPNRGIDFIDRQLTGRSGHMGNALIECSNGDILAFYTNTSGIINRGHLIDGWTEYKRSEDGGKTWSESNVFEYSKSVWEENREKAKRDETRSRLVTAAVTAPNGNVVAFSSWGGEEVAYHLSYDNGRTWTDEPRLLQDARYNYSASFVHDETIYAMFMEGRRGRGRGSLALYVSNDNGETFEKRSEDFFPGKDYQWYQTGRVLEDGSLIVYVYNIGESQEEPLYYVISDDKGYTWSEPETIHFTKRIRNMQMSDKIGDYYFMHGRSGSRGPDSGHLVVYKSKDGINWDDGVFLNRGEGVASGGSDSYTANTVVGAHDSSRPNRLLIQSSIRYSGNRVNTKHWWIENISVEK